MPVGVAGKWPENIKYSEEAAENKIKKRRK